MSFRRVFERIIWLAGCLSFTASAGDGLLDESFGIGGRWVFSSGFYPFDTGLGRLPAATTADGRIYTAVRILDGANTMVVARRMPDGKADESFGEGGFRTYTAPFDKFRPTVLLVQPDGKLVLGGLVTIPGHRASLCRLKENGDLDVGFGGQPANPGCYYINLGPNGHVTALRRQSDGKLVASIMSSQSLGYVMRLSADGIPDQSFGVNGLATLLPNDDVDINDIAIAPDGKIVAAGSVVTGNGLAMLIARLNPADGTLDASFNGSGTKEVEFPLGDKNYAWAESVVVAADGSIIAAGGAAYMTAHVNTIFKTTPAGNVATTFGPGHDGKVVTQMGTESVTRKILLQCDGRILLVGHTMQNGSLRYDMAARRLDRFGNVDQDFGVNGVAIVPFDLDGPQNDVAGDAFLQGGQLVITGYAGSGSGNQAVDAFSFARLTSDTIFCDGFE